MKGPMVPLANSDPNRTETVQTPAQNLLRLKSFSHSREGEEQKCQCHGMCIDVLLRFHL
jgi:hypothetical protein